MELRLLRDSIQSFTSTPLISVVMPVFNTPPQVLEEAIRSVRDQIYEHWELCIADDASNSPHVRTILQRHASDDRRIKLRFCDSRGNISVTSNAALKMATGEFVALLDHDDVLPPHALYWVVEAINRHPTAAILYSDEDKIDSSGNRFDPHFKSDFNHVLLLAQNMISHLGVYRRKLVESVGGFRPGFEGAQDHDLALRCVAAVPRDAIIHIPRILYHWRAIAGSTAATSNSKPTAALASLRSVTEHVQRFDRGAKVELAPEAPHHLRIRYSLPVPPPLASIVICTRDNGSLLKTAISSIRTKTTYQSYEIIILDNGSCEPETLGYLDSLSSDPGITVITDDSPFNYSRLNNTAISHTRGQVICLLNDDIEVISPEWLEEMISFAMRPDIGAVGARLWYPDGSLQHGGVIIGIGGIAGHAHLRVAKGERGYFCRAVLQQELTAVTGACLVVRRDVFDQVGGLDERIAVAFNDVDLCLRIRAAGYRNVWTPFAELIHHESATRGYEDNPEKIARFKREIRFMRDRWGPKLIADPYYNVNLSMRAGDFTLPAVSAPRGLRYWFRPRVICESRQPR